jgi:hypothetical protein
VFPALILFLFSSKFNEEFNFYLKLSRGIIIILIVSGFFLSYVFFEEGAEAKKLFRKISKYINGSISIVTSITLCIGLIFPNIIDIDGFFISPHIVEGEDLANNSKSESSSQSDNTYDSAQSSDVNRSSSYDSSPAYDTEIDDSEWGTNPFDDGSDEVYSEPEVENRDIVYVDSYFRDDGTYVEGHIRTAPDDTITNNFSYEYGDEYYYDNYYYDSSYDYGYDTYDYYDDSYYDDYDDYYYDDSSYYDYDDYDTYDYDDSDYYDDYETFDYDDYDYYDGY